MKGIWAFAMAAAVLGGVQNTVRYDAETTGSYKFPDGEDIRLEGVCSYNDQTIECWKPEGGPNPDLATKIQSYYLGNNQEMNFGFQKKNRLIAFSRSGPNSGMNIQSLLQQNYVQTYQLNGAFGDRGLCWAILKADPKQTSTSLIVSPYGISPTTSDRVPFKDGEVIAVGNVTVTIGGAEKPAAHDAKLPDNHWPQQQQGPPGKRWHYLVQLKSPDANQPSISYQLFDRSGDVVVYVDHDGNPISELTYVKDADQNPRPADPRNIWVQPTSTKYAPVFMQISMRGAVTELDCNVNPSQVGYVRITASRQPNILFKDIPLDPK